MASMGSISHPSSFPFYFRMHYLVHSIVMDHQLLVLQSSDSFPVPSESKDDSLHPAPQAMRNWIPNSLLWRWRWNRSLGWYRSMTWILTKEYFQKKFQKLDHSKVAHKMLQPWEDPSKEVLAVSKYFNIRHPSWRALQSRRCCTCRLNWGRRPERTGDDVG